MQTDLEILKTILDNFPEGANVIDKFCNRDENFREICEDYVLCKNSIKKIIIANTRKGRILKEYKDALIDLEIEMLEYLNTASILNKYK